MIDDVEARLLMNKLILLRNKIKKSKKKDLIEKYKRHQNLCIIKFKYLVTMRTNRYKGFYNYEDLNQEGFEALVKAMANYNPRKGSWFWWAHKYIDTRISRSANLHTAIRYPLKFAKTTTPHKESVMPIMIEPGFNSDKILENAQVRNAIETAMKGLPTPERNIIFLAFGLGGDKPLSINKICKQLSLSRPVCMNAINNALTQLRDNIKL